MKINFRPSTSVCPNLTAIRARDKIKFIDVVAALATQKDFGSDKGDDGEAKYPTAQFETLTDTLRE